MAQTSDLTSFAADLKELYTLAPVRTLNDKSFMHNKLAKEQAVMDFSGKLARFPVTLRRSLGRSSRGDNAILPDAISEVELEASVTMKYHYYGIEWSDAVEQATKNKEGAWEKIVTKKMKNLALDLSKEANRQLYNEKYGALAVVATGAASATQTLVSMQNVNVGDKVDFISPTASAKRNTNPLFISSKDKTAKTITLVNAAGASTSVTTTTADLMIISGNTVVGGTPTFYEVEGLGHICSADRILHGIDSTTYDEWDGFVLDAAGGVASEDLFEQLYDGVGEVGRGDIDVYTTSRGIRRQLVAEFASQRRWVNEKTTDLTAGYESIEVNGKPCVIDDDHPKGKVFGLTMETFSIMQLTEPGFVESEAGGALIELKKTADTTTGAVSHQATYQAWYRYYFTLACQDPARNGVIKSAADA